jgi:1,2-diacylglycerol 3-alpha-glucosyltransferase
MKIAMFTETFLPQVNGVVTSICSFSEELRKEGHEVHIFTTERKGTRNYRGVPVHRFRSVSFVPYPEYKVALFPVGANKIIKKGNFDLVHTHGPFSMGWAGVYSAKRNKLPLLSTFHTPVSEYVPYLFGNRRRRFIFLGKKLAWRYCRRHYGYYNCVITPSNVIRDLLLEQGIEKPMDVIMTGIDLDKFDSAGKVDVRKKYKIGESTYLFHAGRISYEKNIDIIIDALAILDDPEIKLVITGRGPPLKHLQKHAKEKEVENNVIFTGYVPQKDLVNLYREALVSVIASEAETQGLVVLEAMACSTPVIGANYLAIPETLVDGKNGLLFTLDDDNDLSEKMNRMISDGNLRKKLSNGARKTAEENSMEMWTEKLVKVYNKYINE